MLGEATLNVALASITSTLSEMDVQLADVCTGAVEMTESGDRASHDVTSFIISMESDVLWECCNVIMDGDDGCSERKSKILTHFKEI